MFEFYKFKKFIRDHYVELIVFVSGIAVGFLIFHEPEKKIDDVKGQQNVEVRQNGFEFINPLLECEVGEAELNQKYIPFEEEVKKLIQESVSDPEKSRMVSVYFRDLNNGPWFGMNENEDFSPASLLKVPLMIAYFKKAESDPAIFEKKLLFSGETRKGLSQNLKPGQSVENGKEYTVEQLMKLMIIYSDNDAMQLLLSNIDQDSLNKVYVDLGITIPDIRKPEDFMSVKQYASFFRILYNASYLNKENSERALKMLSEVEYKSGVVAGVPAGLKVSHKFGERELFVSKSQVKQLHDCGIVYYPERPYLLCVMTRGDDFKELSDVISNVSGIVYNKVKDSISQAK